MTCRLHFVQLSTSYCCDLVHVVFIYVVWSCELVCNEYITLYLSSVTTAEGRTIDFGYIWQCLEEEFDIFTPAPLEVVPKIC